MLLLCITNFRCCLQVDSQTTEMTDVKIHFSEDDAVPLGAVFGQKTTGSRVEAVANGVGKSSPAAPAAEHEVSILQFCAAGFFNFFCICDCLTNSL